MKYWPNEYDVEEILIHLLTDIVAIGDAATDVARSTKRILQL
jgi:hypothetical protein